MSLQTSVGHGWMIANVEWKVEKMKDKQTSDTQSPYSSHDHNSGSVRVLALIAVGAIILIAWLFSLRANEKSNTAATLAAPTVQVANPLQSEVIEWDTYIGRFEPSQTVQIRPRISGQIVGVHFRDGAVVQRGELLFTIDPRPFVAALAQARAELTKAQSDLNLALTQSKRADALRPSGGISQSDVDDRTAAVKSATAIVEASQAVVRARELDVEFTEIRAPIGGQVSDRRVDAGNQVTAAIGAGGTLMTTINAVDPIYFSFNSSEALYLKGKRSSEKGAKTLPVEIRLQDEASYHWVGNLEFTDNGLDVHSGTIRARATVSNPKHFLTPGMFGDMRMASEGAQHALLVPEASISSDLTRKILLVVDKNNVVAARAVELGAIHNGLRVIRKGIEPNEQVVISGIQLVQPGQHVQIHQGSITAQPPATDKTIVTPQARAATVGQL